MAKLEVVDIFRRHGEAWRTASAGHVSLAQRLECYPRAMIPEQSFKEHQENLNPAVTARDRVPIARNA
jgi:hypothetical protein